MGSSHNKIFVLLSKSNSADWLMLKPETYSAEFRSWNHICKTMQNQIPNKEPSPEEIYQEMIRDTFGLFDNNKYPEAESSPGVGFSKQISSDSLQTSFVIWVKTSVKNHYHENHTENIYVLEGKAKMTVNDSSFTIRKGDFITVLKGEHHSITKVYGRKPLKVLSIQSPRFTGVDPVFVPWSPINRYINCK